LGNKCDLSTARQVTVEEATDFAKRHEMSFLETSALDSTNVTRAFQMTLKGTSSFIDFPYNIAFLAWIQVREIFDHILNLI
jgi:GTPase SAR1 family protein